MQEPTLCRPLLFGVVSDPLAHLLRRVRPATLAIFKALVKTPALPSAFSDCGRCEIQGGCRLFYLGYECIILCHAHSDNVKYHTLQAETSHSQLLRRKTRLRP